MEGLPFLSDDVLVQATDGLGLLGLQVHDVARVQFRAARQVVELQDLAEEQVIALGDGGIRLSFDGIDEGHAVPAVQGPGQRETVVLPRLAPENLAGFDLERRIGDFLQPVLRGRRLGGGAALGQGFGHGHPVIAGQVVVLHILDQLGGIGWIRGKELRNRSG